MPRSALTAVFLILSAIPGDAAEAFIATAAGCRDEAVKESGASCGAVATAKKPATLKVQSSVENGAALELTARPVGGDASSSYVVQVFVSEPGRSDEEASKLLGSFSFYPARIGRAETFILPKPQFDDASRSEKLTLLIKLIPANPALDLKDAAVEILGARVVE